MLPIIVESPINSSKKEWLREMWGMTTYRLQIPPKKSDEIFEEITKSYGESHRAYHNLSHLYSLLMLAEEFYDFIENHVLVDLSIWFHDFCFIRCQLAKLFFIV